ncbi:MAG: excinuclease subunit UvrB, partial [Actinomycetota bacterium]
MTPEDIRQFKAVTPYQPSGDQPQAIKELAERIQAGERDVVLLGATGTGKSATTAWLIEKLQRPTLVIAHNKTLAAQLASELRMMFPENAVEYFVSYYDYYQPEAYVPQTDTFIEKDSTINEEVERLRYSATMSLLSRRDVIVVSTVSCIYGLGAPKEYLAQSLPLQVGQRIDRDELIRGLVQIQYQRNDIEFVRGNFRVKGDTVEVIAVYDEEATRIEFFGDEIEKIYRIHPLTGEVLMERQSVAIYPASYYVAPAERMAQAIESIEEELESRYREFEQQGKLLEAQRIKMRTTFDLEMIRELG